MQELDTLDQITGSRGALHPGDGPITGVIVTPNFYRWHHAQGFDVIDKDCAAHFAFLDHLFGTAVQSDRTWPDRCSVVGACVPNGFLKQLAFAFRWKG